MTTNVHTFPTHYYYIPNAEDSLANYTLYDTFTLHTNMKSKYPGYDIKLTSKMIGENKLFIHLVIDGKLSDQMKRQIEKDIDYFTGEDRVFVILFQYDKKLYTPEGHQISPIIGNQLLQLVNLRYTFNADDMVAYDVDNYEQIIDTQMNISYKFDTSGLYVNLSMTGYYQVLYDMLFQYYYEQVINMFNKGTIFCDQVFAERFNLDKIERNGYIAYQQDWRLYYLFKNKNMTEFLMQLQSSDNSAYFTLDLDDVDRHNIAKYLNSIHDIKYKFYDSGVWIKNVQDFEFIFELANVIDASRSINNCNVELSVKDTGDSVKYNTFTTKDIHSTIKCLDVVSRVF